MTREQWSELKTGDIIRCYRRDGSYYLRTVLDPARGRGLGIHFAIRHKSWTGRMHTVIGYNDLHTRLGRVELHTEREPDRLMTDGELLNLCDSGFNIPRALRRETEAGGVFERRDAKTSSKLMGAAAVAKAFCK
jgi:hypothetical protein